MRTSNHFRVVSLAFLALSAACAPGPGAAGNVCDDAAAHVAACSGDEPIGAGGSCDSVQAASAETVLGQSCEEIAAGPGKNDGADAVCIALVIPLFATHLAPGALCCFGYQCAGSEYTCIAHRCGKRRGLGEACGDDNNACASPLTCLPSKKCGAPLAKGASCAEKSDCASPLTCSASRLCVDALADGAACSRDDQCAHNCIAGTCAARSSEGGACDEANDCTGGLACVSHLCTRASVGSSCERNADCFGALGTICAFHACSPPAATGEACDSSVASFPCAAFGDTCYRGVCEPRHQLGEACDGIFDCAAGLCRNHVCSN